MITRRTMLQTGLLGGGGLLLSGCDALNASPGWRGLLASAEGLHMRSQRLAMGSALAREFAEAEISPSFRPNGSTEVSDAAYRGHLAQGFARWALRIDGLVKTPLALSLDALKALPQRQQITRHDCVEGWSAIGKWQGPQLGPILARAGLLPAARFAVFHCADVLSGQPYYESIRSIDS
jgi:DMSO/TMAO reductase YedYZ molybdopterin-dependent catalytic subunit